VQQIKRSKTTIANAGQLALRQPACQRPSDLPGSLSQLLVLQPLPLTAKAGGADVVFRRSGGRYYLTGVQLDGVNYYSAPPKSRTH
jgi:hypothetical protein